MNLYPRILLLSCISCFHIFQPFDISAQEVIPQLDLDEYQILGRDTRTYQIAGDKIPTVELVAHPLPLPEEPRALESSQAIIAEDERLWRGEPSIERHGMYARADLSTGSNTPATVWGRSSLDFDGTAATVDIQSRASELNTRTNRPPSTQGFAFDGYAGKHSFDLSGGFAYLREDEDLLTDPFRNLDRNANIYSAYARLKTMFQKSWEVSASAAIHGGTFEDNDLVYSDDETMVTADMDASGNILGVMSTITANADFVSLNDDSGSKISGGLNTVWLPWSNFSISAGVESFVSAMPNDDTEFDIYPQGALDWLITRHLFLRAKFNPAVITHSYQDIYSQNALALPITVLYEKRNMDLNGELGFRLNDILTFTVAGFEIQSENRPVFDTSGPHFVVLANNDVDISGLTLSAAYNTHILRIEGEFTTRTVEWDAVGPVPFEPETFGTVFMEYSPSEPWTLYSNLAFYGEHATVAGSSVMQDGFTTIDVGAERELWDYLSVYMDVKNILNSEEAWWTSTYQIPGIGIFGGIRLQF